MGTCLLLIMQIIEIRLDHRNQQTSCETPSFFAYLDINSTFAQHVTQIHAYFSDYLHPFFVQDNLILIGPHGEVDYNVPIFLYLFSDHLKAPVLEAKYRVKDPAQIMKQKGRMRPKNKVMILAQGKLIEADYLESQTISQLLGKYNLEGDCYTSNLTIPDECQLKQLQCYRRTDGNIYIRVQKIVDKA